MPKLTPDGSALALRAARKDLFEARTALAILERSFRASLVLPTERAQLRKVAEGRLRAAEVVYRMARA